MRTMRMEREDIENSLKVLSHIVDDDFIITVDEARKIIRIDGETIEALQANMKTYGDTAFKEGYEMGFAAGENKAEKELLGRIEDEELKIDMLTADSTNYEIAIEELKAQLPKRGKFVYVRGDGVTCCDGWECSVCGKTYHTNVPYFEEYNYCPNCGAKMEVQE